MVRVLLVGLALASAFASLPARSFVFLVDSADDAADEHPGDGVCSAGGACTLRAAVQEASRNGVDDVILLPAGTYVLAIPGRGEDAGATGDLDAGEGGTSLAIRGEGADRSVVDARGLDRLFHAPPESMLEIERVTLRGGSEPTWEGTGRRAAGGAIDAREAHLLLRDVVVTDNEAAENAAIAAGNAVLERVTVRDNTSFGGAAVRADAYLSITGSTIAWNTAIADGGGLVAAIDVAIDGSTIHANDGCGVRAPGSLAMRHATVYGNGGCGVSASGPARIRNSVIADNGPPPSGLGDCDLDDALLGEIVHNAASDATCPFDDPHSLVAIDPRLGPLADHGGPTATQMPLRDSPLRDAADDAICDGADQRGAPRPDDGDGDGVARCDIGAVEAPEPRATAVAGAALLALARLRSIRRESLGT